MARPATLPSAVGVPEVLGPAALSAASGHRRDKDEVIRFRDFWATPAHGERLLASWQQTMGSLVIRMDFKGAKWSGASAEGFRVQLCELGVRVSCGREEAADVQASLSGDFLHEILVGCSWWCFDDQGDDNARMLLHFAKARDRSWDQPFKPGKPTPAADLCADWRTLKAGRPSEEIPQSLAHFKSAELVQEVSLSQTEELVTIRLLLDVAKLSEVRQDTPMSRLWGLDLTRDSIKIFLRCGDSSPILEGPLGGSIVAEHTDWNMTKVTREVDGSAHCVAGCGRDTRPALQVQLRKAPESRREWPEIVLGFSTGSSEAESPSLQIGGLDVDANLALEGAESDKHAAEAKRKGDECFKHRQWEDAIEQYTLALQHMPDNEKVLSNRSASFMELKQYQNALDDAVRAGEVAPEWPKAFFRQGVALRALRRYDMAISNFSDGAARDPANPSWQQEIEDTEEKKAARQAARARASGR